MILLVSCAVKVWCAQNSCVVYSVSVGVVWVCVWLGCAESEVGVGSGVLSLTSCKSWLLVVSVCK